LVVELFDFELPMALEPRFNVAPTQAVLAVRLSEEGPREFVRLRWGLVPSWATDLKMGVKLLNARAETVAEKPSFRDAFRKRRCLIAADGYYEWQTENGIKQPYFIHRADRKPFAFAGLWEHWVDPAGEIIQTCTILTTGANDVLKALHDRMPVVIPKNDHTLWLDTAVKDGKQLTPLLRPAADDELTYYPVTPKVNSWKFDNPACVEPINENHGTSS